jgi:hypothetical protein
MWIRGPGEWLGPLFFSAIYPVDKIGPMIHNKAEENDNGCCRIKSRGPAALYI